MIVKIEKRNVAIEDRLPYNRNLCDRLHDNRLSCHAADQYPDKQRSEPPHSTRLLREYVVFLANW